MIEYINVMATARFAEHSHPPYFDSRFNYKPIFIV